MIVPANLVDRDGRPTVTGGLFLQQLADAVGGPAFLIIGERVSDTGIRFKMKGADGVTRTSAVIVLS